HSIAALLSERFNEIAEKQNLAEHEKRTPIREMVGCDSALCGASRSWLCRATWPARPESSAETATACSPGTPAAKTGATRSTAQRQSATSGGCSQQFRQSFRESKSSIDSSTTREQSEPATECLYSAGAPQLQ